MKDILGIKRRLLNTNRYCFDTNKIDTLNNAKKYNESSPNNNINDVIEEVNLPNEHNKKKFEEETLLFKNVNKTRSICEKMK